MDIKLIAFDLDGTLLDDGKNIPSRNLRALETAAEKGIYIVPATGRIYAGIPESLRSLPFLRYFITVNGAMVYDAAEDRTLHRAEIPAETALQVLDYADTQPVIYDCYKDNWGYISRRMYEAAEDYVTDPGILALVKNLRSPVDSLPELIRSRGEAVQKLQIFVRDRALRSRLMEEIARRFPETAVTSSVPFNIEINSREADKGRALAALCAVLGIDRKDTMAFGDGSNDIAMLRTAGLGVAMANADEEVKRAAAYITGSNNDAGVAAAIGKFVL